MSKRIKYIDCINNRYCKLYKFLNLNSEYRNISDSARILYSWLADRHELSIKNTWKDNDDHVFIYFSNKTLMELLNWNEKKLIKAKKELKEYKLIEEIRQGLGKRNRIYVLNPTTDKIDINEFADLERSEINRTEQIDSSRTVKSDSLELDKSTVLNCKKRQFGKTSTDQNTTNIKGGFFGPSETNINETNINDTKKNKDSLKKESVNNQVLEFFEQLWKLYPLKKSKSRISISKKKELYKIGYYEMKRAIERYKNDKELESNGGFKKYQHGSTFFNKSYIDYLDLNYQEETENNNKINNNKNGYSVEKFEPCID